MSIIKYNLSNLIKLKLVFFFTLWKNFYIIVSLKELKLYRINHPKRARRYKNSIIDRIMKVGNSYSLDLVKNELLMHNKKVINILDCGANIGEVGSYFKFNNISFNYFCFEPFELVAKCLKFNHPDAKIFNVGLSNSNGIKTFYLKNDTNDSSILELTDYDSKIEINTCRLETINEIKILDIIHLLKIDGEGYEPEILKGTINFFNKILYIAVDVSPERRNESTDLQVIKILKEDFNLLIHNTKRGTMLFKNKHIIL